MNHKFDWCTAIDTPRELSTGGGDVTFIPSSGPSYTIPRHVALRCTTLAPTIDAWRGEVAFKLHTCSGSTFSDVLLHLYGDVFSEYEMMPPLRQSESSRYAPYAPTCVPGVTADCGHFDENRLARCADAAHRLGIHGVAHLLCMYIARKIDGVSSSELKTRFGE